ncbi:MAG: glycosyltransferase [Phoenicibacter congonensis]|uniref:Glycosyltransferase n=1 Tax=Phoenicibacter congonensis TaxID=1944646 RepID=A0AA43RJ24_9ACTN|nr:glycosyltransferase [Phoenicibacter congonensis]
MRLNNVKSEPLVSIVVPVYNTADYLDEMLESVTGQTYQNLEIICVNDGSKDNSLDVLMKWAKNDSRIKVIDKANSGASDTRNTGLRNATGDYLCFIDSDDFVEPTLIEDTLTCAIENKVDAVVYNIDLFDEEKKKFTPHKTAVDKERIPVGTPFKASDIDHFYKYLIGFTVNKLYRRSLLTDINLEFVKMGAHEDMPFTYVALSAANSIYYLNKTLYHYRRAREGSLSDNTNDKYEYMITALATMRKQLEDAGLMKANKRNFDNYALHMMYWKANSIGVPHNVNFVKDCREQFLEKFDLLEKDSKYFFDGVERAFLKTTTHPKKGTKIKEALFLSDDPEHETAALKVYKATHGDWLRRSKIGRAGHLGKAFLRETRHAGLSSALNKAKSRINEQE